MTLYRAKFDSRCRETFLKAISLSGNVSWSCERAGISRQAVYDQKRHDPEFSREWDNAIQESIDRIEKEAHRRAVDGVERLQFYQGQVIMVDDPLNPGQRVPYIEREYSDALLAQMLKAKRPEQYRDNSDVNLNVGIVKRIIMIDDAAPSPVLPSAPAISELPAPSTGET